MKIFLKPIRIIVLILKTCMVLIMDGNSEIGVHMCSQIGTLICLRHLPRSTSVANKKIQESPVFLTRAHNVLSYHKVYLLCKLFQFFFNL